MKINSVEKQKRKKGETCTSGKHLLLRMLFTVLLCVGSIFMSYAQNIKTITGKVSEENGDPVIGASIVVTGTKIGTATDLNGSFTLQASNSDAIEVSYLGYLTKRVKVGTNSNFEITLEEDIQKLEEVIVVGYGTQKKVSLTGSVSAIGNKELTLTKSQNAQNLLTGKLPGVRVIQKTSEPGNFNNQFDIRGFDAPLIIVDGVPRDNFERMDPNDIESISILKDASSAVYGVRSANGVVIITTKKGQKGKVSIEYSGYYGLQFPAEILRPVGAYDRMVLINERAAKSTGRNNYNPIPSFSDEELQRVLDGTVPQVDWYDAVLRSSAPQQQHNISANGGSDIFNYFLNFGFMNQEGFFKSKDMQYDRYNVRSNVSAKIMDGLQVTLNLSGSTDKRDRQQRDSWDIFSALWRSVPTSQIYANNNTAYYRRPDGGIYHAVAETFKETAGYRIDQRNIFNSQGELSWDIPKVKGLNAKAIYSYDFNFNDNTAYLTQYNTYLYDEATQIYSPYVYGSENSIQRTYNKTNRKMWNISLNYKNSFLNIHNLNALLLYEEQSTSNDNFYSKRFLRMHLPYLYVGEDSGQIGNANSNGITDYANRGLVGRINYDFKGKYLLEGSFRYDGSSHFLPEKQWDLYYSYSGGWRISEENFIKNNLSFINNLKIRASWGRLGFDNSNLYEFLDGYNYPATGGSRENGYPNGYYFGSTFVPTISVRGTANKDITWYEIYTTNLGLDGDFWKGLFGFSFDFFKRTREGLYAKRDVQLPATFGSDMPQENLNGDMNKGLEIELRHRNKIGTLYYGLASNMSITRRLNTTWVHTPYTSSYNAWRNNKENRYNDIWWGYGSGGRYQSYDEIYTFYLKNDVNTLPGDYYYEDWNNDGVIDDADRYPIATTDNPGNDRRNYPLMNFALSANFQYKGWDFDFMFQGAGMSYIAYGEQLTAPLLWDGNALDHLMDRWRTVDPKANPYNPNTTWIAGEYGYAGATPDANSMFMIQNGAYARLKTVTLGYTLPKKWIKSVKLDNVRLYLNGYNLFTITNVKTVDPEKSNEQSSAMYPLNKTLNFGAVVKF